MNLAAKYAELQSQLRVRQSVAHFAHAAVAILIGLLTAGVAGRLCWDYEIEEIPLLMAVVGLSVGALVYGFVRWFLAKQAVTREMHLFEELKTLRQTLGFEDPQLLLPR
jgi:hypothetical protein